MVKRKNVSPKANLISCQFILLVMIFVLGAVLRLVNLGNHPTFISDEASIGYNAYSILKTGRDEWGKQMPLSFKAFGEYKLPGYIYATVVPVAIFGLNEFSTRFISALAGVIGALFFYLIVKKYAQKIDRPILPVLALFFYVANPWLIQTSRLALEANLGLTFFLAGFWLLEKKKVFWSALLIGLTFYIYNAFRVFVPFWFIGWVMLAKPKWRERHLGRFLLVLGLCLLPLVITGFQGSRERIFSTALWRDSGLVARIGEKRVACQGQLPPSVCRVFYNRPVGYTAAFLKNYLSHFSPGFLFVKGAGLAQYGMPGFGAAYLFEWIFIVVGLVYLLKNLRQWPGLLVWLLVAPVANSITGLAHPVRSLVMAPLIPFVSALGAVYLYHQRPIFKRELLLVIVFSVAVSLGYFANRYFSVYPLATGSIWQQGYRPLFDYLEGIETRYERVQVTKFYGEPHIFYLFYRQVEPSSYQSERGVVRYDREDHWTNVDQIGKYYFFHEKPAFPQGLTVFSPQKVVGQPGKLVYYRNGQPAFVIQEL